LCSDAAHRQLDLIQRMSAALDVAMRDQPDPDVLDALYTLDSLTCQGRRLGENLLLLSGRALPDSDRQVTSLDDIIRAAQGRIAGWQRVTLGRVAEIAVAEYVSGDLIRVMTELLDNAARFSPRSAPITASAHLLVDGGVLLRVEDEGNGLTEADQALHNELLRGWNTDGTVAAAIRGGVQQGFQVVRRAVGPHGIEVSLAPHRPRGVTAHVYVPPGWLCEIPQDLYPPVFGVDDGRPFPASDQGRSTPDRSNGRRGSPDVRHRAVRGLARPAGAGAVGPPLPIRTPRPLRNAYPMPPPGLARRVSHGPGPVPEDPMDQIVAFDAATGGTPSPADPEGADT
jgi:hypothetical protein